MGCDKDGAADDKGLVAEVGSLKAIIAERDEHVARIEREHLEESELGRLLGRSINELYLQIAGLNAQVGALTSALQSVQPEHALFQSAEGRSRTPKAKTALQSVYDEAYIRARQEPLSIEINMNPPPK